MNYTELAHDLADLSSKLSPHTHHYGWKLKLNFILSYYSMSVCYFLL